MYNKAMDILIGIIIGVVIFGGLWLTLGKRKEGTDTGMLLMQQQLGELTRTIDTKLNETSRTSQWQFGESRKIIEGITERLARLDETNRQVVKFADQLKNLQEILKNPKQRGILGEYYLETVLKNVLPPGGYQMQYPFKDGSIVDAVIFTKEGVVPVDSKFSLENYNRILRAREENDEANAEEYERVFIQDLKNRIDETAHYVKPEDGTLEFAFMFIPSEAVYYDVLVNRVGSLKVNTETLLEYAGKKKVMIVSPTTFLAYLQTVLQGLRALRIEESAKDIRKRVYDLGKHLTAYEEYMKKLGNHLGTTVSSYNTAYKELGKIDKDVMRISGEAGGIEPSLLDAPETTS